MHKYDHCVDINRREDDIIDVVVVVIVGVGGDCDATNNRIYLFLGYIFNAQRWLDYHHMKQLIADRSINLNQLQLM